MPKRPPCAGPARRQPWFCLGLLLVLGQSPAAQGADDWSSATAVTDVTFQDTLVDAGRIEGFVRWTPPSDPQIGDVTITRYFVAIAGDSVGTASADLWDRDLGTGYVPYGTNQMNIWQNTGRLYTPGNPADWLIVHTWHPQKGRQPLDWAAKTPLYDYTLDLPSVDTLDVLSFTDEDPLVDQVGGTAQWTIATGADLAYTTEYVVYLAADASGTDEVELGTVQVATNQLAIPSGTAIDVRKHLLVYPKNPNGRSASAKSLQITDLQPTTSTAALTTLTVTTTTVTLSMTTTTAQGFPPGNLTFEDTNMLEGHIGGSIARWIPPADESSVDSYSLYIAYDAAGAYLAQLWYMDPAAQDPEPLGPSLPVGTNEFVVYEPTLRRTTNSEYPANWLLLLTTKSGVLQPVSTAQRIPLYDASSNLPGEAPVTVDSSSATSAPSGLEGTIRWSWTDKADLGTMTHWNIFLAADASGTSAASIGQVSVDVLETSIPGGWDCQTGAFVGIYSVNPNGMASTVQWVENFACTTTTSTSTTTTGTTTVTTSLTTSTASTSTLTTLTFTITTTTTGPTEAVPTAVTGLTFADTNPAAGQIGGSTITWTPPSDTSLLTHYTAWIAYNAAGDYRAQLWWETAENLGRPVPVGTNSFTIYDPTERKTGYANYPANWLIVMTAKDGVFEPIETAAKMPLYDLSSDVPGTVSATIDFTDTDPGADSVGGTIQWAPAAQSDLGYITTYEVYLAQDPAGTAEQLIGTTPVETTELDIPGGTVCTGFNRYIQIYAVNPNGRASSPVSILLPGCEHILPPTTTTTTTTITTTGTTLTFTITTTQTITMTSTSTSSTSTSSTFTATTTTGTTTATTTTVAPATVQGANFIDTNPVADVLDGIIRWNAPADTTSVSRYIVYMAYDAEGSFRTLLQYQDPQSGTLSDSASVGTNQFYLPTNTQRKTSDTSFPANWLLVFSEVDGQEQPVEDAARMPLVDNSGQAPGYLNLTINFTDLDDMAWRIGGTVSWSAAAGSDLGPIMGYAIYVALDLCGGGSQLLQTAPRGATSVYVPLGTIIGEAEVLLIYPQNSYGTAGQPAYVLFEDVGRPPPAEPTTPTVCSTTTTSVTTTTTLPSKVVVEGLAYSDTDARAGYLGGSLTWSLPAFTSVIEHYEAYLAYDELGSHQERLSDAVYGQEVPPDATSWTLPANTVRQTVNADPLLPANWLLLYIHYTSDLGGSLQPVSDAAKILLYDQSPDLPSVPDLTFDFTDLTVSGSSVGGTVAWTPASSEDLAIITHYAVYLASSGLGTGEVFLQDVSVGTDSVTIPPGTDCSNWTHILVYAVNPNGRSPTATSSLVPGCYSTTTTTTATDTSTSSTTSTLSTTSTTISTTATDTTTSSVTTTATRTTTFTTGPSTTATTTSTGSKTTTTTSTATTVTTATATSGQTTTATTVTATTSTTATYAATSSMTTTTATTASATTRTATETITTLPADGPTTTRTTTTLTGSMISTSTNTVTTASETSTTGVGPTMPISPTSTSSASTFTRTTRTATTGTGLTTSATTVTATTTVSTSTRTTRTATTRTATTGTGSTTSATTVTATTTVSTSTRTTRTATTRTATTGTGSTTSAATLTATTTVFTSTRTTRTATTRTATTGTGSTTSATTVTATTTVSTIYHTTRTTTTKTATTGTGSTTSATTVTATTTVSTSTHTTRTMTTKTATTGTGSTTSATTVTATTTASTSTPMTRTATTRTATTGTGSTTSATTLAVTGTTVTSTTTTVTTTTTTKTTAGTGTAPVVVTVSTSTTTATLATTSATTGTGSTTSVTTETATTTGSTTTASSSTATAGMGLTTSLTTLTTTTRGTEVTTSHTILPATTTTATTSTVSTTLATTRTTTTGTGDTLLTTLAGAGTSTTGLTTSVAALTDTATVTTGTGSTTTATTRASSGTGLTSTSTRTTTTATTRTATSDTGSTSSPATLADTTTVSASTGPTATATTRTATTGTGSTTSFTTFTATTTVSTSTRSTLTATTRTATTGTRSTTSPTTLADTTTVSAGTGSTTVATRRTATTGTGSTTSLTTLTAATTVSTSTLSTATATTRTATTGTGSTTSLTTLTATTTVSTSTGSTTTATTRTATTGTGSTTSLTTLTATTTVSTSTGSTTTATTRTATTGTGSTTSFTTLTDTTTVSTSTGSTTTATTRTRTTGTGSTTSVTTLTDTTTVSTSTLSTSTATTRSATTGTGSTTSAAATTTTASPGTGAITTAFSTTLTSTGFVCELGASGCDQHMAAGQSCSPACQVDQESRNELTCLIDSAGQGRLAGSPLCADSTIASRLVEETHLWGLFEAWVDTEGRSLQDIDFGRALASALAISENVATADGAVAGRELPATQEAFLAAGGSLPSPGAQRRMQALPETWKQFEVEYLIPVDASALSGLQAAARALLDPSSGERRRFDEALRLSPGVDVITLADLHKPHVLKLWRLGEMGTPLPPTEGGGGGTVIAATVGLSGAILCCVAGLVAAMVLRRRRKEEEEIFVKDLNNDLKVMMPRTLLVLPEPPAEDMPQRFGLPGFLSRDTGNDSDNSSRRAAQDLSPGSFAGNSNAPLTPQRPLPRRRLGEPTGPRLVEGGSFDTTEESGPRRPKRTPLALSKPPGAAPGVPQPQRTRIAFPRRFNDTDFLVDPLDERPESHSSPMPSAMLFSGDRESPGKLRRMHSTHSGTDEPPVYRSSPQPARMLHTRIPHPAGEQDSEPETESPITRRALVMEETYSERTTPRSSPSPPPMLFRVFGSITGRSGSGELPPRPTSPNPRGPQISLPKRPRVLSAVAQAPPSLSAALGSSTLRGGRWGSSSPVHQPDRPVGDASDALEDYLVDMEVDQPHRSRPPDPPPRSPKSGWTLSGAPVLAAQALLAPSGLLGVGSRTFENSREAARIVEEAAPGSWSPQHLSVGPCAAAPLAPRKKPRPTPLQLQRGTSSVDSSEFSLQDIHISERPSEAQSLPTSPMHYSEDALAQL